MSLGVLSQEMPASKRGSLLRRTEGASNHRQRTVMMTYCPRHQGLRSPDAGCDFIIKILKKTTTAPFISGTPFASLSADMKRFPFVIQSSVAPSRRCRRDPVIKAKTNLRLK